MIPGKFIDIVELPKPPSGDCLAECGWCLRVIHNRCDHCGEVIRTEGFVACEAAGSRYPTRGRHVHHVCIRGIDDWLMDTRVPRG